MNDANQATFEDTEFYPGVTMRMFTDWLRTTPISPALLSLYSSRIPPRLEAA